MPPQGETRGDRPIGFIPEDRTSEGLIQSSALPRTSSWAWDERPPWIRAGGSGWRQARDRNAELLNEFGIVAEGPDVRAGSLSGGNQQKLIVARELARQPAVIVAENPTEDSMSQRGSHPRPPSLSGGRGSRSVLSLSDLDEVSPSRRTGHRGYPGDNHRGAFTASRVKSGI